MINSSDQIRVKNIISKKYYYNYGSFQEVMKDFLHKVNDLGAHIKGLPFYSINSYSEDDGNVVMEFFIPVRESYVDVPEDMAFHSYFSIEDMISLTAYDTNPQSTKESYEQLVTFMQVNGLRQTTPFFYVISGDDTFQYVFIKVGVSR